MALSLSATLQSIIAAAIGRPVEIHDIYLGSQTAEDSNTLHFVNYYKTINFFQYISGDAQAYIPLGLMRAAITKSTKGEIDRVGYKIDNVNKAMGSYAASKDFRNKRIVTRLIFRNHLSNINDSKIIFDGLIQGLVFKKNSVEVVATPLISSLSFETGWAYQINCSAKFGDEYCQINKNSITNRYSGTVDSGSVVTLTDASLTQADDYWNHGYVEITSGTHNGLKRKVIDFDADTDTLTLDYAFSSALTSGDAYTVYRGCDKTLTMCQDIYINDINYHGFHAIPLKSNFGP